jgi:diguanylate cyclase (GGDEF)-like protein
MFEPKALPRGRTLLAGKVISNFGQSSIDCVVRRISDHGATISVESPLGIPRHFQLLIPGEGTPRACKLVWQSDRELGLEFEQAEPAPTPVQNSAQGAVEVHDAPPTQPGYPGGTERRGDQVVRSHMLALRAALDEIETGVVLLDGEMRATFINRTMWKLSDELADSRPSFVALMYHGRDTRAYEVAAPEMDAYVAERIRLVQSGDPKPRDLRRSNGEVLRMQCAVLPNGGRMLSYTNVTDIVRHSDELEVLRNALDNITDGVLLLDAHLNAQFLNRKVRDYLGLSEQQAAAHPAYAELLAGSRLPDIRSVPADQREAFVTARVEAMRKAEVTQRDTQLDDGRHIRIHCTATPNGGRMLMFADITDLIHNADLLEKLATIDSMTGLSNRRHFLSLAEAEWARFQRYQRPLSMLMLDIDHFKSVNDRYGHAVGDDAIISVAHAAVQAKRGPDVVGRLGGEEFAILLPETDAAQAAVVAERIRQNVEQQSLSTHNVRFGVTISVGIATASTDMSGIEALLRKADEALYEAKSAGRNRVAQWSPQTAQKLAIQ